MSTVKAISTKQQEWLDHLELARTSGLSLTDYARQLGLNVNSLYHWKHVLARQGLWQEVPVVVSTIPTAHVDDESMGDVEAGLAFVPVQVTPAMSGTGAMELTAQLPNGVELHFGAVGLEGLPTVVQALAQLPCSR